MIKLCDILGSPTEEEWPEGHRLAERRGLIFPKCEKIDLSTILKRASKEAIELIEWMLKYNPLERPSASQLIIHPFFSSELEESMPKEKDIETFDSLKISRNGIRIRKNQKFQGLKPSINLTKGLEEFGSNLNSYPSIQGYQKVGGMQSPDRNSYPSMYQSTEESKYSEVDYNKFKDSALLANEKKRRKKNEPKEVVRSGLNSYQSLGDLKSDRVFKNAALNSIDKPPMIPRIPKMPIVSRIKDTQNKAKNNSLRRSNTYKNFKRVSEMDRASAPIDNNEFRFPSFPVQISPDPSLAHLQGYPPPQKLPPPVQPDEYYSLNRRDHSEVEQRRIGQYDHYDPPALAAQYSRSIIASDPFFQSAQNYATNHFPDLGYKYDKKGAG
ncbi:unnamed protein product [Moneuplotes crassus]|uniref:Uncharacterized protein n=1 Tax=Euplotes crassus TaxID=5936 RepID=A0AAD1UAX6_EUPCR|nr:unnamed protein product [Moneuplotes crassus]